MDTVQRSLKSRVWDMQNRNSKCKRLGVGLSFFAILITSLLSGCGVVGFLRPEGPPGNEQIMADYNDITVKLSSAADVLIVLDTSGDEGVDALTSQSKSVIVSAGQKKKGYKRWFNMAAFDEDEFTVMRKYVLIVDEKPKVLFTEPRTYFSFDCRSALSSGAKGGDNDAAGGVLDEPYANENAKRIAVLKRVLEDFQLDLDQVKSDNKVLAASGGLVNQVLTSALVELEDSPGLAGRLSDAAGMKFEHISLGTGKIRMLLEDDVVTIRVRLGSVLRKLKKAI